eukprot:CAMPEP_0177773620 /NCGR_PEP_ID=MMETSP0491_2-20121128/12979_1 /TAXON_ID=63592 /ORGANISM="Tetraselmis chuii, Strain PLY429" /LENGTH=46 /DNA_ID= /DNA_START= /DNA_END= /DNA_ORIENTATION=
MVPTLDHSSVPHILQPVCGCGRFALVADEMVQDGQQLICGEAPVEV